MSRSNALRLAALLLALPALFAAASAPASAEGEILILPSAGYYLDAEEPYVGLAVEFPIGNGWRLSPGIEYVFVDDGDLYALNVDFIYDFEFEGGITFWAGAGPALVVADYEDDGVTIDDTDLGLDVLGGVSFDAGAIDPFLQVKFTFADDTETVLTGGIRF